MLSVPVFNVQGQRVGEVQVDPATLGGTVRPALIKQAIVTHQDHQRLESARLKGRGEVEGSTRKIFRQKGTGNARMGPVRTPQRRGGGRAFSKQVPRSFKDISKKIRRMARLSAVLAKIQADDVMIVEGLQCTAPKTKPLAEMLKALQADRGCVLAIQERDENIYKSGRNIEKTEIRAVDDLNAHDVLLRKKLIFTRPAFDRFTQTAAKITGQETKA